MKYFHSDKHQFTYGVSSKLYQIEPGNITPKGSQSIIKTIRLKKKKGLESAIYISDEFEVNKKLLFDIGLRYSVFSALGANFQNVYEDNRPRNESSVIEVKEYDDNETIKTYGSTEFRLSMRYFIIFHFIG